MTPDYDRLLQLYLGRSQVACEVLMKAVIDHPAVERMGTALQAFTTIYFLDRLEGKPADGRKEPRKAKIERNLSCYRAARHAESLIAPGSAWPAMPDAGNLVNRRSFAGVEVVAR